MAPDTPDCRRSPLLFVTPAAKSMLLQLRPPHFGWRKGVLLSVIKVFGTAPAMTFVIWAVIRVGDGAHSAEDLT
jgi:hypothetical protein